MQAGALFLERAGAITLAKAGLRVGIGTGALQARGFFQGVCGAAGLVEVDWTQEG